MPQDPVTPNVLPAAQSPAAPAVREQEAVVLFDLANPRSLINLLPPLIKERVSESLWDQEELFQLDEQALYKRLRDLSAPPSATDNRLRLKFWMEYEYCQMMQHQEIQVNRVIAGICTYEYFRKKYLQNPKKVAWMLCPPTGFMVKAQEALEFGVEEMRSILEIDHMPGGKINVQLARLKLSVFESLNAIVNGAPVQRSISATVGAKEAGKLMQNFRGHNMQELEKQLTALKKREQEMTNGGNQAVIVDVSKA